MLLLVCPWTSWALDNDLQAWPTLILQNEAKPHHVRGYLEFQPRLGNALRTPEQMILRVMGGYQLTPTWSLWQGYVWGPTPGETFRDLHQSFQQVQADKQLGQWTLSNRTRLEQRWLAGADGTANRLRHRIQVSHPLPGSRPDTWYVTSYQEGFVHFNSVGNGPPAGLDQTRSYVGLGRRLNRHARVETGYLLVFRNQQGDQDRLNHCIVVTLSLQR